MKNLLSLFIRYSTFILFVLLEIICFFLIINFNNKQKSIFIYSSNQVSGAITSYYEEVQSYFNLQNVNDSLRSELAEYYTKELHEDHANRLTGIDTLDFEFELVSATICNKTINKRNNIITIDVGTDEGVTEDMGVISKNGIVGITRKSNSKYTTVVPILNTSSRISASLQNASYFGDLIWQPYDTRYMMLKNIPQHAPVSLGESVVTSGYSTVFPKGITIGHVKDILPPDGTGYHSIVVSLVNDLAKLNHVYVVRIFDKEEITSLEEASDE